MDTATSHIPTKRVEDDTLLRGTGRYMADAPLPGQTYACFVRSQHACADIKSIDTKAALAIKGVIAVITGRDMPERIEETVDRKRVDARIDLPNRSLFVGGSAVHVAAQRTVAKARELAARELEVAVGDVEYADGVCAVIRRSNGG